ncbi:MAG: hypothetical protein V4719_03135 [Planctomycetota bacterium]
MYLREIDIRADERIVDRFLGGFVAKFNRDCCCITELYASLLSRRVATVGIAKLVFIFSDLIHEPPEPSKAHVIYWPFPFAAYVALSQSDKKQLIHNRLFEALTFVGGIHGWSSRSIEAIFADANATGLVLKGIGKNCWKSPSGEYRAWVEFVVELDAVYLECILTTATKRIELARRTLGTAIPQSWCLKYYLSVGRWITPTVFQLSSTDFQRWKRTADFSDVIPG